jgi:hypothetical protein
MDLLLWENTMKTSNWIAVVLLALVGGHQYLSAQDTSTTETPIPSSEADLTVAIVAVNDAMTTKRAAEKALDDIEQRRREEELRAAETQRQLAEEKLAAIKTQLEASRILTAARSRVSAITSQLAVVEQLRDAEIRLADANRRLGLSPASNSQPVVKATPAAEDKAALPDDLTMKPLDNKGDIIEKFEDGSWGISLSTGPTFVVKKEPTEIKDGPGGKIVIYKDGTKELVDAKGKRKAYTG